MSRRKRGEPQPKNFRVLLIILEQNEDDFVCLCPAFDAMIEIHINYELLPAGAIEYIKEGNRYIHCETNLEIASVDDLYFINWEWGTTFLDEANSV